MAVLGFLAPVAMGSYRSGNMFALALSRVGFFWLALVGLLFAALVVTGLARALLTLTGVNAGTRVAWARTVSIIVTVSTLFGVVQAFRVPSVVRYTVDRRARYNVGKTLRIAQISDLHLGPERNEGFIKTLEAIVSAEKPDIIVLTGDIMDTTPEVFTRVAPLLSKLTAAHGIYAVSGNHDFYSGIQAFMATIQQVGIPVLGNQVALTSGGVQVAGIHDAGFGPMGRSGWAGAAFTADLPKVLSAIDQSKPSILLQHQPSGVDPSVARGVDLILAGHTHNGQVFPMSLGVKLMYPHSYGRYDLGPNTTLIVSSGAGIWGPPVRLLTQSEVVIIDFLY